METLLTLKANLRKEKSDLNKIEAAKNAVNSSDFTSINANGSFAYIAGEDNMNSYWNLGKIKGENIRDLVQTELMQIDTDLKLLKSFSTEVLAKADEKIKELESNIEALEAKISILENEQSY